MDPESTPTNDHAATDDPRWLDQPGAVDKIIWALCIASALTVFADLFYHKHGHFGFQEWFAFDAVFGFAAYVGLVNSAKLLRKLVMRDEDYYEEAPVEGAPAQEETSHD